MQDNFSNNPMPLIFVGHGNPMNAITKNSYSDTWRILGQNLPTPSAVLCISAHWLTNGTFVTMSEKPKTIHDFVGFPDELFAQDYPALGAISIASLLFENIEAVTLKEDYEWGLDHGCWSVLMNMYPKANIPVIQLSIDNTKTSNFHYKLGSELTFLRNHGVLIIASGNIVHNISKARGDLITKPYDWAIEFDEFVKQNLLENNDEALILASEESSVFTMAHPTDDHYIPLLYVLGAKLPCDNIEFFNDSMDMGSISMRSAIFYSNNIQK